MEEPVDIVPLSQSPQRIIQKTLAKMMSDAAKVASKKADMDMMKIETCIEFLSNAKIQGFDTNGILDNLKTAIRLAEQKADTRALTRLIEIQMKMFMEVQTNIGDQIIKLTQTQIKVEGKGGMTAASPESERLETEKLVIDTIKGFIDGSD